MRCRSRTLVVGLIVAGIAVTTACVASGDAGKSGDPSAGSGAANTPDGRSSVVVQRGSEWFRAVRVLDVTMDSAPDTLVLVATGTRSDSLDVTLRVVVGGDTIALDGWKSGDELVEVEDSILSADAVRDEFVRNRLEHVLADVSVGTLTSGIIESPETDTAALGTVTRELGSVPPQSLVVSYGYETGIIRVWSAKQRKFLTIQECC